MPNSESVFTKFLDVEKEPPKIIPQIDPKSQPLGRLLYWLTHHWKKPTISVRDICVYGPYNNRDRESAIDLADTLAQRGFLLPIRGHRIDRREWLIVRQTEQIGTVPKNGGSGL
jgi:hypothetical protein